MLRVFSCYERLLSRVRREAQRTIRLRLGLSSRRIVLGHLFVVRSVEAVEKVFK